jgi:hypothetical protein
MKPSTRLDSRLFTVRHPITDTNGYVTGEHVFELQFGYEQGRAVEVAFAGRGKLGSGLDFMLLDVGLWLSRILQNRDPMTGAEYLQ